MTIKEFASAIGVSPATVSRAVRGCNNVNPHTRALVLSQMNILGYRPNLNAQRLVTGKTRLIALSGSDQEVISDPFLLDCARYLQETLSEDDYNLMINLSSVENQENTTMRWIHSRMIDGVVLAGYPDEEVFSAAREMNTAVVVISEAIKEIPGVGFIAISIDEGAKLVAEYYIKHGHKNIGYIGIDFKYTDSIQKVFVESLAQSGIVVQSDNILKTTDEFNSGAACFYELMKKDNPPTAIFCRSDTLAIGALGEAKRMNIRVPQEVSICGHDDIHTAATLSPSLTTLSVDYRELSKAVVSALNQIMDDPSCNPNIKLFTKFIERESTGPAPC